MVSGGTEAGERTTAAGAGNGAAPRTVLRRLRIARGWSQEELARRARVAARTVHAAEKGEFATRMHIRRRILAALHVPLSAHRDVFGPLPAKRAR